MVGSPEAERGKTAPCPIEQLSFTGKPLPSTTRRLTGTLSEVQTLLLSSMLKLIARSRRF